MLNLPLLLIPELKLTIIVEGFGLMSWKWDVGGTLVGWWTYCSASVFVRSFKCVFLCVRFAKSIVSALIVCLNEGSCDKSFPLLNSSFFFLKDSLLFKSLLRTQQRTKSGINDLHSFNHTQICWVGWRLLLLMVVVVVVVVAGPSFSKLAFRRWDNGP